MIFKNSKVIASIIAVSCIVLLYLVSLRLSVVLVFIPAVIISYLVYLKTFEKGLPVMDRIIPLYLFTLGWQFIHFLEEFLTGFETKLPELFGQDPYQTNTWVSFNMIAYFIFILGGIALYKNLKGPSIIAIFFILFGVMFNGIAHVGTSIYTAGYFPGLYTALAYLILGPILIKRCFLMNMP